MISIFEVIRNNLSRADMIKIQTVVYVGLCLSDGDPQLFWPWEESISFASGLPELYVLCIKRIMLIIIN